MLLDGSNRLCKEAEKYYYDFICPEQGVAIPREIMEHIHECQGCRRRIERLQENVLEGAADGSSRREQDAIRLRALRLHFALIGKPVTCEDVRPFLPGLLEATTSVHAVTPVTAHIAKCSACMKDLETIGALGLKATQLHRLSQVFADRESGFGVDCTAAQADLLFTGMMTMRETDAEVLKHICCCPECRLSLHAHRACILQEVIGTSPPSDELCCESIGWADIFDYVVPYGLNPSNDQYARFRESLTSHLRECPKCLARMQELHELLYGIAERRNSDVMTVYRLDREDVGEVVGSTEQCAAVGEGLFGTDDTVHDDGGSRSLYGKRGGRTKRRALQAVTFMLLGVLLAAGVFFQEGRAEADAIQDILDAAAEAGNVHIMRYDPEKDRHVEDVWVSRSQRALVVQTANTSTLVDLRRQCKITGDGSLAQQYSVEDINPETEKSWVSRIEKMSDILPDTRLSLQRSNPWLRIINERFEDGDDGNRLYKITIRDDSSPAHPKSSTWIFFLDGTTSRPYRIEYWRQTVGPEPQLQEVRRIEYISAAQMQERIDRFYD